MIEGLKFHHIGIACFDIENTVKLYKSMMGGGMDTKLIFDPLQNVRISFLSSEKFPLLEFLAPVDEKSPVNRTLEKCGVSPYHICYEVKNIENAIDELKKNKFIAVSKPVPACALENRRVCFLFNKNAGLIELLEEA